MVPLVLVLYLASHEKEYPGLNCAEPLPGAYTVGSRIKDEEALGGFSRSDHFPKPYANRPPAQEGAVSLIAFPAQHPLQIFKGKYEGDYRAMGLRLINRTDRVVAFAACDSRLYLAREALTAEGRWQRIETFAEPICGNSFHRVFLAPNEQWEFIVPYYAGSLKTKLRFVLAAGGDDEWKATFASVLGLRGVEEKLPWDWERTFYSNEFEGSVNPGQFVQKPSDERVVPEKSSD